MGQTLTISDELYERLMAEAAARGQTIEQLLEQHAQNGTDLQSGAETVKQIDQLRNHLFSKYGKMPDSTPLIREDRTR